MLKIPEEKRNFKEYKGQIQTLIYKNEKFQAEIQSKNDVNIQNNVEASPLQNILNNPGLVHIAENIFGNFTEMDVEVCQDINQSSNEILNNPMFWLRRFGNLSKENQKDWFKVLQSVKTSKKEKAIVSYLQWILKKDTTLVALVDLPCYNNPDVQEYFRMRILKICLKEELSDEDTEIVKILAPLTDNPNAPDEEGVTPIFWAACCGNTEIVKILAPLTDNPNAPDEYGHTPIYVAAKEGHTEIVKILAPLTNNPNAPNNFGMRPSEVATSLEIRKFLKKRKSEPSKKRAKKF